MDAILWSWEQARATVASPDIDRMVGVAVDSPVVAVELGDHDGAEIAGRLSRLPVVSVGVGSYADYAWDIRCDDPEPIIAGVLANPIAAVTTAQVLRDGESRGFGDALLVESLAYATLQSGAEFASWLATQGRRVRNDDHPRVRTSEHADRVDVILDRPRLRNLINARMRDELIDTFGALAHGPTRPIRLSGEGPAFCAGGDPAEFGTVADPATAHMLRSTATIAVYLHRVADRVTAQVHGPCVGAGVEIMAFCDRVQAHPDTWFRLPETRMGLLPGVGGTVSIPARIGRHRTLAWLLQDSTIDANTALKWGLIDSIQEPETDPADS
ncbi:MAG: enoyl-CoA hydratase/isomerase family protein [Acidimicrobiaceae bacterium]|nr:enoyl-CoA hydratase/isomerase family protein [Acidimicrobiaceae bacterium]MYG54511.1 enoyl-CoA hydratase/isomerase family protein [Acidimicrobiaceae bacterium]MYK00205.1 enoyl-CoA hydratase/isomerase family protein [Acidimicrobiaceae bacterium]